MSEETTTETDAPSRAEERIRSLSAERRQLREQLADLQSRYEQASELVKQADTYKATASEWETKFKQAGQTWETERELFKRGITDQEGMDFVRMAYDRLPAEGRPALGDWLAEADKLPKAVRAYMPDASPAPTAAPAPAPSPTVQTPRANAAATSAPASSSAFAPEAISRMSPQEYAAHRAAILETLRG